MKASRVAASSSQQSREPQRSGAVGRYRSGGRQREQEARSQRPPSPGGRVSSSGRDPPDLQTSQTPRPCRTPTDRSRPRLPPPFFFTSYFRFFSFFPLLLFPIFYFLLYFALVGPNCEACRRHAAPDGPPPPLHRLQLLARNLAPEPGSLSQPCRTESSRVEPSRAERSTSFLHVWLRRLFES